MKRSSRGFTLLEVLVAMSLFTLLGYAVVTLMKSGVEMYLGGNMVAQQEDRLELSLPRLEEDLRMMRLPSMRDRIPFDSKNPDPEKEPERLPPENRFLSGVHKYKIGREEVSCRWLAFVRDVAGLRELDSFLLRAGTNPKADAVIDGKDDEEEHKNGRHLASGGEVEVLWIWLPDERKPGVGAVHRAYRTPIGGPDSLLDPKNHDTLERLREKVKATPIFTGVLRWDLLFWTQYTTTWEWREGEPRVVKRPATESEAKLRAACGPSRTWDSTRGLLSDKEFLLAKPNSFTFAGDDIWPRRVRVEFSLVEDETVLARGFSAGERDFVVEATDFATGRGELFSKPMRIGLEWVLLQGRDPQARDRFRIESRGALGTSELVHGEGTPVYFGRMFDFAVSIPAFRDDNN